MKTTIDLPEDLVHQLKLRAVHEGRKLKDAVADVLRQGLAKNPRPPKTKIKVNKATLKRRAELTRKFVTGEWGVELDGFEAAAAADRLKEGQRAVAWRE